MSLNPPGEGSFWVFCYKRGQQLLLSNLVNLFISADPTTGIIVSIDNTSPNCNSLDNFKYHTGGILTERQQLAYSVYNAVF